MANNRRKKSNSRKPEPAKAQKAVVNEVKEMDEIDAVEEEDIVEDEVPAMSSAERDMIPATSIIRLGMDVPWIIISSAPCRTG